MSNKVFIGVESFDEMARRVRETARRVDAVERVPETDYYLNFSRPGIGQGWIGAAPGSG